MNYFNWLLMLLNNKSTFPAPFIFPFSSKQTNLYFLFSPHTPNSQHLPCLPDEALRRIFPSFCHFTSILCITLSLYFTLCPFSLEFNSQAFIHTIPPLLIFSRSPADLHVLNQNSQFSSYLTYHQKLTNSVILSSLKHFHLTSRTTYSWFSCNVSGHLLGDFDDSFSSIQTLNVKVLQG